MNINNDIDMAYLNDAMELLRGFPVGRKNVNQVTDVTFHSNGPLTVEQVLNRLVRHFGGARWGATYKLAQALLVGAVTITTDGFVEVTHV